MEIIERINLEQVRQAKPKTIYYGANTCWWTHDSANLSTTKQTEIKVRRSAEMLRANSITPSGPIEPFLERARRVCGRGLPCDPRGGVLFETDDIEGFFKAALSNAAHYGRHGFRAFMAAHHVNCILSLAEPRPWCSPDWLEYNEALDALDERNRLISHRS